MSAPTDDGDGMGMHPDFSRPEPAQHCAHDDPLGHYALGWIHGYEDCETHAARDKPKMNTRGIASGVLISLAVWVIVGLFFTTCHAQTEPAAPIHSGAGAFNYGYVSDSARTFLEQGWDTQNAAQVERGYCIEPADVQVDTAPNHANVTWRIHHVTIPTTVSIATPYAISFTCSPKAVASMHVHTPTTCARDPNDPFGQKSTKCRFGGGDGYLCSVDETDRTTARHDWFMVVQCGRGQFIWYWPGKRG